MIVSPSSHGEKHPDPKSGRGSQIKSYVYWWSYSKESTLIGLTLLQLLILYITEYFIYIFFLLQASGCDNVMGSFKEFDKCGVCDGNNSTCHSETKTYNPATQNFGNTEMCIQSFLFCISTLFNH